MSNILINEDTVNKNIYLLINAMMTVILTFVLYKLHRFNIFSILNMSYMQFFISMLLFILTLIIHELIHILAFKYFGRGMAKIKVKLSLRVILIQQVNKNLLYTRNEFIAILLLPYVLITLGLTLTSLLLNQWFVIFYISIILNSIASMIDIGISIKLLIASSISSKVEYSVDKDHPYLKIYWQTKVN